MEYILAVLIALISGAAFYIKKLINDKQKLRMDLEGKEFEVHIQKKSKQLAMRKAALEGAKRGATKAVDQLREHLRAKHGIVFDPDNGVVTESKTNKED